MYTKTLDRFNQRGKRTSRRILRLLSRFGLLPTALDHSRGPHGASSSSERVLVWDARLGTLRDLDHDKPHGL